MIKDSNEYLDKLILPPSLYREIEQKVVEMFLRNNVHYVPIDPFEIAQKEGYELIPFSKLRKSLKQTVKSEEYDGMSFHYTPRRTYIIFYDDSQSYSRQRFTIFHELGHIDMGHKEESDLANKIANHFAAYAIAPYPLIAKYGCKSTSDLQRIFFTSSETASYRWDAYKKWLNIKELTPNDERLLDLFYNEEE